MPKLSRSDRKRLRALDTAELADPRVETEPIQEPESAVPAEEPVPIQSHGEALWEWLRPKLWICTASCFAAAIGAVQVKEYAVAGLLLLVSGLSLIAYAFSWTGIPIYKIPTWICRFIFFVVGALIIVFTPVWVLREKGDDSWSMFLKKSIQASVPTRPTQVAEKETKSSTTAPPVMVSSPPPTAEEIAQDVAKFLPRPREEPKLDPEVQLLESGEKAFSEYENFMKHFFEQYKDLMESKPKSGEDAATTRSRFLVTQKLLALRMNSLYTQAYLVDLMRTRADIVRIMPEAANPQANYINPAAWDQFLEIEGDMSTLLTLFRARLESEGKIPPKKQPGK